MTGRAAAPVSGLPGGPVLLALNAGVRETGWAIFQQDRAGETGIIQLPRRRRTDTAARVLHLAAVLDVLVDRCQPAAIAYGQPSGVRWPEPALELLDASLVRWSAGHRLPLYTYPAAVIRAALLGHSRVPPEQLAYAVMARLRLIGYAKSTQEWEALAVGCCHLDRWGQGR